MNGRSSIIGFAAALLAGLLGAGAEASPLTFSPIPLSGLGGGTGIAVADFNRDGLADLPAVTGSAFFTFIGNGDGSFQTPASHAAGNTPDAVATGNFTGNGREDVVVANFLGNNVSVFIGNGDGTFQTPQTFATGDGPNGFAVGSFDSPLHQDFAVANYNSGTVSVFVGDGAGNFVPGPTLATGGAGPSGMVGADFNGDGRLDLAVANQNSDSVGILLNGDNAVFGIPIVYFTDADPTTLGGPIWNGFINLLIATDNGINTLSNLGNGIFAALASVASGSKVNAIEIADLDDDGRIDIVAADQTSIFYFLGNGDGTFHDGVAIAPSLLGGYAALAVADFNGDGRIDIAAGSADARFGLE